MKNVLCQDSGVFFEWQFSVLTGDIRLNIIGAKLYKTVLAIGERKRGVTFLKKGSIFLSPNAKTLLVLGRDAFHLATLRRQG